MCRWASVVLLGAFSLVSLQGCGEKSEPSTTTLTTTTTPSGRTSCWVKTGSVKEARTKPCDKSKGSQLLSTPDVRVTTVQKHKSYVHMELRMDNQTFQASDRSAFSLTPHGLTQVTLQVPSAANRICVILASQEGMEGIIVAEDMSLCPQCADPKTTLKAWILQLEQDGPTTPCPYTNDEEGPTMLKAEGLRDNLTLHVDAESSQDLLLA